MPTLPSPSHEAIQSIALRPGRLNKGRITLLSKLPNSSNKPKLSSKGNSKPAKINTENSVGSRPCKTSPPVFSSQIAFGPIWKNVMITAAPPITRTVNQSQEGLNKLFKKGRDMTQLGLKTLQITEATDIKAMIAVTTVTRESPNSA
ncbi:Uncharacterised protein [Vibrio cholerae]|nr:Uncharacterised protein [Vibrio cholerae]